ncbi:1,2-dihydroxy-3-keto-5-methylthiopentene dioxygenase [Lamellibrachia satsuma]|nr:1,2-dihydroxy-3-keto-5-methylthiopentene dioxygenase [Lamellibrachia satsuma]
MVRAWYVDESGGETGNVPHDDQLLDLDRVKTRTGIRYYKINVYVPDDPELEKAKQELDIRCEDTVVIKQDTPDDKEEAKKFGKEHLHGDDEIRLTLGGGAYFDVRDTQDRWVRLDMVKGDLIVLPAGIYHRLTMPYQTYAKFGRYFSNDQGWTAHWRPADDHPARIKYLAMMSDV